MAALLHSYSGTQFPPKFVIWGQCGMGRETTEGHVKDSVARSGSDIYHFFPVYRSEL